MGAFMLFNLYEIRIVLIYEWVITRLFVEIEVIFYDVILHSTHVLPLVIALIK